MKPGDVVSFQSTYERNPDPNDLRPGDVITFAGDYRRRTFWEWLMCRSRQLQRYVLGETVTCDISANPNKNA